MPDLFARPVIPLVAVLDLVVVCRVAGAAAAVVVVAAAAVVSAEPSLLCYVGRRRSTSSAAHPGQAYPPAQGSTRRHRIEYSSPNRPRGKQLPETPPAIL